MATKQIRRPEVLYARIESVLDRKEYQRRGRCVRMLAVEPKDFARLEEPEGIDAITVDLSYWNFFDCLFSHWWRSKRGRKEVEREFLGGAIDDWYELTLEWSGGSKDGYLYPTFSETEPIYFQLKAVRRVHGPSMLPVQAQTRISRKTPPLTTTALTQTRSLGVGNDWRLLSFHVGQGMCSLLTDGEHGVLLDVGAGTPILRPKYLHPAAGWRNDLKTALDSLKVLDLVLSHADRDHWRLLAWDSGIRAKLRSIYVPTDAKSLALKDTSIKKRVVASRSLTYILDGGGRLEVKRSKPTKNNDNTHCLVAMYESDQGNDRVLMSGDYVYKDMRNDTSAWFKALKAKSFSAVVVPHHGDEASKHTVFTAASTGTRIAFFSAGDHDTWNHPNPDSKTVHEKEGYLAIIDKHSTDIIGVQLAP